MVWGDFFFLLKIKKMCIKQKTGIFDHIQITLLILAKGTQS